MNFVDNLNHEPDGRQSARWFYDEDEDALVVTAKRAMTAGEEVTISYGLRSNAQLFSVYGFTIHPALEPIFAFRLWVLQLAQEFPDLGLEKHLAGSVDLVLRSPPVKENPDEGDNDPQGLDKFLNATHQGGMDPEIALAQVLEKHLSTYNSDEVIAPFREQLAANRQKNRSSWVWWSSEGLEGSSAGSSVHGDIQSVADASSAQALGAAEGSRWHSDVVRVKMSEYLCLTVHQEALQLYRGNLDPSEALHLSVVMSTHLAELMIVIKGASPTCSREAGHAGCAMST